MIPLLKTDCFNIMAMDNDIKNVDKFSNVKIFYQDEKYNFCLAWESFNFAVNTLQYNLLQAIQNQSTLNSSIVKPLGYYETEYYHDGTATPVSTNYLLFSSSTNIPSSWLYNDQDGNIILEISPIYPWLFEKPKPGERIIPYEEWMQNYQPYVVRKIPKDLAQKWLTKIDVLISKIEKVETNLCIELGCKLCAKEGKSGCPCGSTLK